MKPELLARILRIIAKTGEKIIICDHVSGVPFVIMDLDSYEKIAVPPKIPSVKTTKSDEGLTQNPVGGIIARGEESSIPSQRDICSEPKCFTSTASIDPDAALLKESKNIVAGEWGGDEKAEDDQYYMEPAE